MLIIKMIMRITNYNQEELANYLGVSRASINSWINSEEEMTTYQKNIISNKFEIPVEYLDVDLNQDLNVYRNIYNMIDAFWKRGNINNLSKEDQILNMVEHQVNCVDYEPQLTDKEIINALSEGYDPFTGEVYEGNHILNNMQIKAFLFSIKNKYFKYGTSKIGKEDLSSEQYNLFQKLRNWRIDKTIENDYYGAYVVFNDKELINIVTAPIEKKEDLLNIKGIGPAKFKKYGDELFEIIQSERKNNFNQQSNSYKFNNVLNVKPNTTVTLKNLTTNEVCSFNVVESEKHYELRFGSSGDMFSPDHYRDELVFDKNVDLDKNEISIESPFGKCLKNGTIGKIIDFRKAKYEILGIKEYIKE